MQSQAQPGSIETAVGNGDCAFNAFALGFGDPAVLAKVQLADDNYFVVQASRALALRTTTWSELKTAILRSDRLQLQLALAPLLRQIAIQTIINDRLEKQKHLTLTKIALAVEFKNYIRLKNDATHPNINNESVGDIFFPHQFIKNKFAKLHAKPARTNVTLLQNWWNTEGHDKFLHEMESNGVNAGDLELAALGRFFGSVNLNVRSIARNINTQIYHADGHIPQALQNIRGLDRALVDRNVIYQDTSWKKLTRTELTARLSAVPQQREVCDIIKTLPRKRDPVPAQLGAETLDQLYARGIIDKTKKVFALNINVPAVVLQRVGEIAQKDLVIHAWENTYKEAATISLQNENAVHWNTVHVAVLPNPPKATATAKKAVPYQATEYEKEINKAANKVFDLLNRERSPTTEQEIKKHFEKAYDDLSNVLQEFQAKRRDIGFFKQAKENILQEAEQNVSKIRSKRK